MVHSQRMFAVWLSSHGPDEASIPPTNGGWIEFSNAACRDGLAGLILESAKRHSIPVPDHCRVKLRTAAMAVAARNIALRDELERVLVALEGHSIPVILLKGAALLGRVYKTPDLRPMTDLDLLIHSSDLDRTRHALLDLGCREGPQVIRRGFFPRFYYETEFITNGMNPARVDLHVRPFRPLRYSQTMADDALWANATMIECGASTAFVPRREYELIHLAVHAAFHGWARLIWLYDIKRFIDCAGTGFRWPVVRAATMRWKLDHAIHATLVKLCDLFGEVVPPDVLAGLSGTSIGWRDRVVLANAPSEALVPARQIAVNLLSTTGFRFRLAYIWAHLRPDRHHLAGLYPFRHKGWLIVAHGWRWIRGIWRSLRTVQLVITRQLRNLLAQLPFPAPRRRMALSARR